MFTFLKAYKILYSEVKNSSFLKTEFGIFQLQAHGNPGVWVYSGNT